ncbi:MAG: RNA polymerase factor sigma-54 [Rhodothalassiaceae bacterium]
MSLSPRLDLRLGQHLVLTPQLQQAIKLLQMANLELEGFVAAEIERNPLLEEASPQEDADEPQNGEAVSLSGFDSEAGIYGADAGLSGDGMVADSDAPLDAEFEGNVFDDAPVDSAAGATGHRLRSGADSADGGFESRLSESPDLREHLRRQMPLVVSSQGDRLIASYLIDLVEESGYLTVDPGEIAERLGVAVEEVERVRRMLQSLEPTGVFAASLAECLALQLRERDRFDPAMQALVANLDRLARRDLAALERLCGVDSADLAEMIAEIRALDPRPGLAFSTESPQTVIPDVFVTRLPRGGWAVELNGETLPRVLVNQRYYSELSARAATREEKHFLSECMSNANWLVRALDQRARTILKVSQEIVRQQEAFLDHGIRRLRPLTLRDIADVIGMHESTVSRVTSNKYMATPRGVFELKYFFTSAIASAEGGEAISSEAVRERIRALIDAEDPKDILSDDRLVALLRAEGIDIARRTVAKYREAMRIPSSVQRRREKRMMA